MDAEQILDAVQEASATGAATAEQLAERLAVGVEVLLPELETLTREGRLHRLRYSSLLEWPADWTHTYLVRGKR